MAGRTGLAARIRAANVRWTRALRTPAMIPSFLTFATLLLGASASPAHQGDLARAEGRAERSPHGFTRNVAVLVFDGVELLDFAGPVEALSQANRFDPVFRIYTVGLARAPLRTNNVVTVVPDFTLGDCPVPDILVIPGGETGCLGGDGPMARFVREQVPKVEIAFSVCNGAFSLAENGFLDGLEATTFHSMTGWLRQAAPKATVREGVRFVDNGHIVMAAGVSAGIDGALHLIDRLVGAPAARKAASNMEYAWRDDPGSEESIGDPVERARRAWYTGDFKAALAEYRALAAEHPDDRIVLARLGTCLAFARQEEEALGHLQRAIELGARDGRTYGVLGMVLSRRGRHAEALAAITKAREIDPNDRDAIHQIGMEQFELGDYASAITNLRRALELHRGDDDTRVRIAQSQALLGDVAGAVKTLEEVDDDDGRLAKSFADARYEALRKDPRFVALLERAKK